MKTVSQRVFICKLIGKMTCDEEFSKKLGLINRSEVAGRVECVEQRKGESKDG